MKTFYGIIRANVRAEGGRRVNWAMQFDMPDDAPDGDEDRLAQRFCKLMGWSYIMLRRVSPETGRELLELQQNRAEG